MQNKDDDIDFEVSGKHVILVWLYILAILVGIVIVGFLLVWQGILSPQRVISILGG